jgi:hypothetical protein
MSKWIASYYEEMDDTLVPETVHKTVGRIAAFSKRSIGGFSQFFDESVVTNEIDFKTPEGRRKFIYRMLNMFAAFELRKLYEIFKVIWHGNNVLGAIDLTHNAHSTTTNLECLVRQFNTTHWAPTKNENGVDLVIREMERLLSNKRGLSAIVTSTKCLQILTTFDPLKRRIAEGGLASHMVTTGPRSEMDVQMFMGKPVILAPSGSKPNDEGVRNLTRSRIVTGEFAQSDFSFVDHVNPADYSANMAAVTIPSYENENVILWQKITQEALIDHMEEFSGEDGYLNYGMLEKIIDDCAKSKNGTSKFTKIDVDKHGGFLNQFIRQGSKDDEGLVSYPECGVPCAVLGDLDKFPVELFVFGAKTLRRELAKIPRLTSDAADLSKLVSHLYEDNTYIADAMRIFNTFIAGNASITITSDLHVDKKARVEPKEENDATQKAYEKEVADDKTVSETTKKLVLYSFDGKKNAIRSTALSHKLSIIADYAGGDDLTTLAMALYAMTPLKKDVLKRLCRHNVFVPIGGYICRNVAHMSENMVGLAGERIGFVNFAEEDDFFQYNQEYKAVNLQHTMDMATGIFNRPAIAYMPHVVGAEYLGGAGHRFFNEGLTEGRNDKNKKTKEFGVRVRSALFSPKKTEQRCLFVIGGSPNAFFKPNKVICFESRGNPRKEDFFHVANPNCALFDERNYVPSVEGLEYFWYSIARHLSPEQAALADFEHAKLRLRTEDASFLDELQAMETAFLFLFVQMNHRVFDPAAKSKQREKTSFTLQGPYYEGSQLVQEGAQAIPLSQLQTKTLNVYS